jgi:antitoxin (DNA-binding transcriptional repressor) of toxin-antitoxin stability system
LHRACRLAILLANEGAVAQFSVHQAKTNLSRLIADALDGGEVVIARGAVPVVRLTPVEAVGRRRFGAMKGRITVDDRFDEPLPPDELAAWEQG